MATDTTAIYTTALRNTHALESQGLSQIEHQLSGLEHYPDYANLLRAHVQTTQEQLKRLEQALSSLSTSASTLKESVTNTAGKVGAAVHALAQDETLKNLYAGYGYQYHQIAAYRSLIAIAEAAGHQEHVELFRKSLEEEKQAAQGVDGLIESVTRTYVERTTQDAKADS
jgi:ferritin-like metal-binding protein YciE